MSYHPPLTDVDLIRIRNGSIPPDEAIPRMIDEINQCWAQMSDDESYREFMDEQSYQYDVVLSEAGEQLDNILNDNGAIAGDFTEMIEDITTLIEDLTETEDNAERDYVRAVTRMTDPVFNLLDDLRDRIHRERDRNATVLFNLTKS